VLNNNTGLDCMNLAKYLYLWMQANSPFVQAASSLLIATVTIVYVVLTYKLLHAQHKAYLAPISIDITEAGGWVLKIKNFGPGLAKNLQVRAIAQNFISFDPLKKGTVWVDSEACPAEGSYILMPNTEENYIFNKALISFDDPFYITWKSITEKTQKTSWLIKVKRNSKITPLDFYSSVKLKIRWYRICLLSPLYILIKWLRFKIAS
jgi:hypothetical protein